MTGITMNKIERNSTIKISPGLKGLESYTGHDTFVYVLRSLYSLVFKSKELGENKLQLQRRIRNFEEKNNLPGFLSAASIDELLEELEDAQYFYPIRRREVNFPTFH
ncbi:MAG: hypothetical protein COV52_01830 [Gammaproteobacteria bacterium CG11_big_fil_rev_8_21_14_0_20_46_22]|nr:MAG: hypothetical protein COW05_05725 [Gammaproteobacteria bacterium CG12_big_fil_rev_8_21_14_0_65_46_12]PIR11854.1 MAG: hypothetical protein COV52_01830 [Gammaproteobacteria bacterium CG11_big_fil_rev_8_21_14_0_20_46_22]